MWLTMYQYWDGCQGNIIPGGQEFCGLVYLGTLPLLFHQHSQYSVITDITMTITVARVPIVKINLILLDNQEVIGINLSFVKVLFMLNIEKCFILGILVAGALLHCHLGLKCSWIALS